MKQFLFILLIGLSGNMIFAQDLIVKKDGSKIKSEVIEVTNDIIRYKNYNHQDETEQTVKISEVKKIVYENGVVTKPDEIYELIKEENENLLKEEGGNFLDTITVSQQEPVVKEKYNGNYSTIGIGYGNSYGGFGIRAQMRMGGEQGVGFHVGVGYFPHTVILTSVGVKFYPYQGFYFDLQFGTTGYTQNGYDSYGMLFGTSFLVGYDQVWGKKPGFGFNIGIGPSYNFNFSSLDAWSVALDIGFLIRIK